MLGEDEENRDPAPATTVTGTLALVGSGEYLEVMTELEGSLLHDRPARYVQLATAAHHDGPDRVAYWHDLGRRQAERLGVQQIIVPVDTREDADNPEYAELIRGAGLIYLSGGDPAYLADTLRETAVWRAIESEWRAGASLAGCSAGAMVMTSWIPSIRHPKKGGTEGLGLLPHLRVIPHFDYFGRHLPDVVTRFVAPDEPTITLLGIDEETALVGGPHAWRVWGRQSVWHLTPEGRSEFPTGSEVVTD
jgi:cyanophycinase